MSQIIECLMLLKSWSLNYTFGISYLYLLFQTVAFAWQSSHGSSCAEMLKDSCLISYGRMSYFLIFSMHCYRKGIWGYSTGKWICLHCHSKALNWMRISEIASLGPKPFTTTETTPCTRHCCCCYYCSVAIQVGPSLDLWPKHIQQEICVISSKLH